LIKNTLKIWVSGIIPEKKKFKKFFFSIKKKKKEKNKIKKKKNFKLIKKKKFQKKKSLERWKSFKITHSNFFIFNNNFFNLGIIRLILMLKIFFKKSQIKINRLKCLNNKKISYRKFFISFIYYYKQYLILFYCWILF
jgi:hypothetical protein